MAQEKTSTSIEPVQMTEKVQPSQPQKKRRIWKKISHNLVLHSPSGIYYVRKFKAGKGAFFRTTGINKKGLAQTKADEMISDWLGNRLSNQRRIRLGFYLPELKRKLQKEFEQGDRSEKTWDHDQTYLKVLDTYFGAELIDEIDENFWEDWVREKGRQLGRETLFDVAKYLSIALNRAYREGLIQRKPQIKNPDRPKPLSTHRLISQAESEAIAQVLIQKKNDWLLLQLLLGGECGNRTGEVRTLEWPMITFSRDEEEGISAVIRFSIDKANRRKGRGREFAASPQASQLLWKLYQKRNKESLYVFPRPTDPLKPQTAVYQNRAWRQALKDARITRPIWFYWLRHTFYTTALLDARMPIQHVSEFGGTSIRTLQKVYLHSDAKRTREVSKAVKLNLGKNATCEKLVNDSEERA